MNSTVTRAVPLKDIDFRLAYEELYRKPYKKLKDGTYACVYLKHPFKTLQNAKYNDYIDQLIAIYNFTFYMLKKISAAFIYYCAYVLKELAKS